MPCLEIGPMTSKVVCVTSIGQVGATFLDWSLHWLAGHTEIYNVPQQQWIKIPNNPLTDVNAHQHPKNHPEGHGSYLSTINALLSNHTDQFHSCYPSSVDIATCADALNIDSSEYHSKDIIQWLITTSKIDFAKIISDIFQKQLPLIFISADDTVNIYQALSLSRDHEHDYEQFHRTYFSEKFDTRAPIWDQREILALNLQFDQYHQDNKFLNFSGDHLWINCRELWSNGEHTVIRCLEYINESLDTSRLEQWRKVHQQWQDIQQPMITFSDNIEHIVECTVRGWHYSLPRLTLLQEAIIQHRLIYQHNLNIRNWQLDHFPDNTNKLHQLLEKNQHPLRDD
jgi:hypothetical protein